MYASNNRLRNLVKAKLLEVQKKDEYTSTNGHFNNPLSKMEQICHAYNQ
jgi:hypothetical protein